MLIWFSTCDTLPNLMPCHRHDPHNKNICTEYDSWHAITMLVCTLKNNYFIFVMMVKCSFHMIKGCFTTFWICALRWLNFSCALILLPMCFWFGSHKMVVMTFRRNEKVACFHITQINNKVFGWNGVELIETNIGQW